LDLNQHIIHELPEFVIELEIAKEEKLLFKTG
jgi:hypothetical protein